MKRIEVTVFRKANGILSKRIWWEAGKVKSDGSECRMSEGEGRRVKLNGIASLGDLIGSMRSNEALALGRLRADLPERVPIVTKAGMDHTATNGAIARSGEYLHFAPDHPAYMLLDHDSKGMPNEIADKLKKAGGVWKALAQAVPALADAERVHRLSTTAGLYHSKTDESIRGSKGLHIYMSVGDGSDIERALKCLHERLWLAGYGYYVVGGAGQLLDRSIIDASVYGPERLVFEGAPMIEAPLAQDREKRTPRTHAGSVIDTRSAIPDLSAKDRDRLAEVKAKAGAELKGAAEAARRSWAGEFARRHGLSKKQAEHIATQALNHILEVEFVLRFDDPTLGTCTVADVLTHPKKYLGKALADPLEGVAYGRGKAKVLQQRDRCLLIHSFAHGGINYRLAGQGVVLEAFRAYKPKHNYIYTPTGEAWPAGSVNASIPPVKRVASDGSPVLNTKGQQVHIVASEWLDRNQSVEQITWAPGLPELIEDRHISEGGWIRRNGVTCLNLYRPPNIKPGDPSKAGPWLDHLHRIYPDDADHFIKWFGHRVQRPEEKPNHALVLGGLQGIGKDTALEPVKDAVGPWNFYEVSPKQLMGRFNGFLKSVILRVSEARDLGEFDRFDLYDHLKAYTAAPPDVLRVDEKNLREHSVVNVCGIIITTNHKTDGVYLPADDRRHYVAWSEATKEDFDKDYWNKLWGWYRKGGKRHVAAYLAEVDLTDFDPKAPPPKTPAFWAMVDSTRAPEEAELADLIDTLENPNALTLGDLREKATALEAGRSTAKSEFGEIRDWLADRKNRRIIPHRLEAVGYTAVRNDDVKDGLWVVQGRREVIYAKTGLTSAEKRQAARKRQRR
jgi:hypothetical protein